MKKKCKNCVCTNTIHIDVTQGSFATIKMESKNEFVAHLSLGWSDDDNKIT